MNCKDCKFWERERDDRWQLEAWKGVGECKAVVMCESYGPPQPDASKLAYVIDASDYSATLWCKPDFGCVEFVPKTP